MAIILSRDKKKSRPLVGGGYKKPILEGGPTVAGGGADPSVAAGLQAAVESARRSALENASPPIPPPFQQQGIDAARAEGANAFRPFQQQGIDAARAEGANAFRPFQQQGLGAAKAEAANAPGATPFNPLQNAVDYASMPPVNPLQNAVDTAAGPENLANRIPPIGLQDLIPAITAGNTQGAMTPPITAGNTDLASMISPITSQNTQAAGGGAPIPTPRPNIGGGGSGGGGGGGSPVAPHPLAPPAPDPRVALAQQMMASQSPRAQEAGYTTSGRGWPGKSSAIFGRNARR